MFNVKSVNTAENKRHFCQLDGEGIRYEIVAFAKAVESGKQNIYIGEDISIAIVKPIEAFKRKSFIQICYLIVEALHEKRGKEK